MANKILSFILQKTDCIETDHLLLDALCGFFFIKIANLSNAGFCCVYKTTTYSSVYNDAFSFVANQAALAGSKKISIGVYGEWRFMLADLSSCQLVCAVPSTSGNFGLQAHYFGNSSYNQSQLGLAYARGFGKIDIGAQFNYQQIKVAEYGNASAIDFEAGAILHVSDQFQTGIHVYNPTHVSIGKNAEEKLPFIYSFGLGYDVSEKFFIGSGIEKIEDQPVNINAGLHYSFDQRLFARIGMASATSSFYLGAGFLWND